MASVRPRSGLSRARCLPTPDTSSRCGPAACSGCRVRLSGAGRGGGVRTKRGRVEGALVEIAFQRRSQAAVAQRWQLARPAARRLDQRVVVSGVDRVSGSRGAGDPAHDLVELGNGESHAGPHGVFAVASGRRASALGEALGR